jgi:hypothetical protein
MTFFAKGAALFAAAAALATPVEAACWSDAAYRAAQVRELDTMLMVEALRCRRTAPDFVSDYNAFVQHSRPALVRVNDELRQHFAANVGAARALDAYDRYVTTVANRYGAGVSGLGCDDMRNILRAAAGAKGALPALIELAEAADMQPALPGARCTGPAAPLAIASRR